MALTIEEVDADFQGADRFLSLVDRIYAGDSRYCKPARPSTLRSLRRPEFREHQRLLLAVEEGVAVARAVARISPALTDPRGRSVGMVGFFEALDRPDAVRALLEAAVSRLRAAGAGTVVGPMDGDTWHRYRFSVGPDDRAPFLMEPYNPPYYPGLWEGAGFRIVERYFSSRVDDVAPLVPALRPKRDRAEAQGYRFRPLEAGRFREELAILYGLSRETFQENAFYTDITLEEFLELYLPSRRLLEKDLSWFALAPDGRPAGFIFAFPDYFRAVASMQGRTGVVQTCRFLWNRRHADAVNFKTIGVVKEHRRAGLGAALAHCMYSGALALGYRAVNLCLMREGNPSSALAAGRDTVFRRYHLYEWFETPDSQGCTARGQPCESELPHHEHPAEPPS